MHVNSYVGVIEQEVSRLLVSRAHRLRIGIEEIDDLQQKIVPMLIAFKYDEAKSNGASFTTVMTSVIDRQIKQHLRGKHRYQMHLEKLKAIGSTSSAPTAWPEPVANPEPVDLRMDLTATMERLSERDRTICRNLGEGHTIKDIARKLGCTRGTVSLAIARIRRIFEQAGLRAWIDPNYGSEANRA